MGNEDPLTEDSYTLCGEKDPASEPKTDPTTENLCNVLAQRQEFLEFHVPPVRTEVQPSPYPKFTEYQLNMRRKAEILAYKHNGDSLGVLTKSQQWANLAKNPRQLYKKSSLPCPDESLAYSLSSSCDVPGPIITLYKDKNVPLYNFGYSPYSYNLQPDTVKPEWKTFPRYDIEFENDELNYVAELVLYNPNNDFYTYRFQTSISIYIDGQINDSGTKVDSIKLSISNPKFAVYFSNLPITTITPIVYMNVQPVMVFLKDSSPDNFNASIYTGLVNVSNFRLQTQSEYVYDLKMLFHVSYVLYDSNNNEIDPASSNIDISTVSTILNLTGEDDYYYLNYENCLVNSVSSVPFADFTLTGVSS